ncbi:hypothetical protein LguiB_004092 [Lonicera macranthoides]
MSRNVERVLVIQGASGEPSTNAIRWTLQSLSLKPGDKIKIIRVVQPFSTTAKTSSSSFLGCGIVVRYKIRLHSSVTIKNKQRGIEEYITEKEDEYQNSAEIKEIRRLLQMQQIDLDTAVEAAHSLKEVAVQAAMELQATWLILDRNMKKDEKYLKENLTCGILRMKHNGLVEHVREPKEVDRVIISERSYNIRHVNLETSTSEEEEIFKNATCSMCKNRRPRIGLFRKFEYSELQFATEGFSEQNVLSQRGREIYKGRLIDGQMIVIRKSNLANIKEEEFQSRVQMLGMARHENVAMLLGSCSQKHLRLLVYEYVCNGSLNMHLSRRSKHLTWERRMKIARGVAKGLMYLHGNNIFGNLRPNNILITHDYEPLLTNIGLARNQYEGSDHSSETRVLKTFEYLAPEYEETGLNSSKADIYSFGVVLLELITGRKTIEETHGQSFLRWARPLVKEKRYGELADPKLPEPADIHQLFCTVRVAEKCLSTNPWSRHPIEKVVDELTCIIQGKRIEDFSPTESEMLEKI